MTADIKLLAQQVIGRAPDWIRRDLMSRDIAIRSRAEDALAAMIAAALEGAGGGDTQQTATDRTW